MKPSKTMKIFSSFSKITTILLLVSAAGVSMEGLAQSHGPNCDFLLQLKPEHNIEQWFISGDYRAGNIEVVELISEEMGIYLLETHYVKDRDALLEEFKANPLSSLVQFNHHNLELRGTTPNDGNLPAQWYLDKMDATLAWDITQGGSDPDGEEYVIAVVDEGFDLSHNDLLFYKNFLDTLGDTIDNDGNGYLNDYNGWNAYDNNGTITGRDHGTAVSGIIGARTNNGLGIAGINWSHKVLPIMGLSSNEATVVKAYTYIYNQRKLWNETGGDTGAYIIAVNSSFGVDRQKPADYPIWCSMYDSLGSVGILSIAATANSNDDIDFWGDIPTTCPSEFLVAVTSTNRDDALSVSPSAARGLENVDIGAPGFEIYTTRNGGFYGSKSGTSYAAPMVTGTLGLMYSAMCDSLFSEMKDQPDSLALVIRDYLLNDGVDLLDTLSDKVASGGRLNLFSAVQAVNRCFVLSDSETLEEEVRIFPNPSNGALSLNLDREMEVSLLDIRGAEHWFELLPAGEVTLDFSYLPNAMYFINFRNKEEVQTYKWVIK